MFPGIEAGKPVLAILGVAVAVSVVKLGLKIFGKGDYTYYADTLGIVIVAGMALTASLGFLKTIAAVFK